jgi:hypothetical protein
MERIIQFKKYWPETYIRVAMIDGVLVEIDVPVAHFITRFTDIVRETMPDLRFRFTNGVKDDVVRAVGEAFEKTVSELKHETVKA